MTPKQAISILTARLKKYAEKPNANGQYISQSEDIINSLIKLYNDYEAVTAELEYRTQHEAALIDACMQPSDTITLGDEATADLMAAPISLLRWHEQNIWIDRCSYDLTFDRQTFFQHRRQQPTIQNIANHHRHLLLWWYDTCFDWQAYNNEQKFIKCHTNAPIVHKKPSIPEYAVKDEETFTQYIINHIYTNDRSNQDTAACTE